MCDIDTLNTLALCSLILIFNFFSSKIKLCAFAKDTDACQGDSGGPLTVPENGWIIHSHAFVIRPFALSFYLSNGCQGMKAVSH